MVIIPKALIIPKNEKLWYDTQTVKLTCNLDFDPELKHGNICGEANNDMERSEFRIFSSDII